MADDSLLPLSGDEKLALVTALKRLIDEDRYPLSPRVRTLTAILARLPIGLIGAAGLLLAILHGIEAGVWSTAYCWLGALRSPAEAMLYSVDSLTTRGASGLILEPSWRMMGALESADGMLLFGISTAFIFSVMQRNAQLIIANRHQH
jgi:hypothetical protein